MGDLCVTFPGALNSGARTIPSYFEQALYHFWNTEYAKIETQHNTKKPGEAKQGIQEVECSIAEKNGFGFRLDCGNDDKT